MRTVACVILLSGVVLRLALPIPPSGRAGSYSFHFHLALGGTEQEREEAMANHRHGTDEPCSPTSAARQEAPAPGAVRVLSIVPAAGSGASVLNISGIVAAGPDQALLHSGPAWSGRAPTAGTAAQPLPVPSVPEPPPRAA
jgi:hypothetical protein